VKKKKRVKDAEDRKNPRRRVLRSIEDREMDDELRHLDDDLFEWPEVDELTIGADDDWLA
jgi:hypothetical protein